MDFSRLRNGEIVAAIGGLALFIFMFFSWFGGGVEVSTSGTQEVPGIGEIPNEPTVEESGVSGWDALQDFSGFLIALAAVSGVALGGLAAAGQRLNIGGVPRGGGTAVLGSLAVLLILWRFFANPGDLKIGIFLGLVAAIAIAVGALMALREDGFEPLVNVPGGRTKAAAETAPIETVTPGPTAPGGGSGSSSGGSSSGGSSSGDSAKSRSSGGSAPKSRSSGGSAPKSRSSGASAPKSRSRSSGGTKSKSRSSGRKTTMKKSASAKKSSSSRTKSGGSNRSKKSSGARKSSGASKTKTRSNSSGTRARSKSSGSKSTRSKSSGAKSSGTRRRSSGKRK